jgi:hypothetical protein
MAATQQAFVDLWLLLSMCGERMKCGLARKGYLWFDLQKAVVASYAKIFDDPMLVSLHLRTRHRPYHRVHYGRST